jgi:hypothetical protein
MTTAVIYHTMNHRKFLLQVPSRAKGTYFPPVRTRSLIAKYDGWRFWKKKWTDDRDDTRSFPIAIKELRSFIMAYKKLAFLKDGHQVARIGSYSHAIISCWRNISQNGGTREPGRPAPAVSPDVSQPTEPWAGVAAHQQNSRISPSCVTEKSKGPKRYLPA